jgi:hypothetical protein
MGGSPWWNTEGGGWNLEVNSRLVGELAGSVRAPGAAALAAAARRGQGQGRARRGGSASHLWGRALEPLAAAQARPAAAVGPGWAPRGPRPGRRREEGDWVGPSGSAQLDRIDLFFFFEIFFWAKINPEMSR